ncbi:MAG: YqgE/AlgH family protein [Burkholderiales bacterium]|nr:YqgE/AlgH family protein [Burkholderiales bacterium]
MPARALAACFAFLASVCTAQTLPPANGLLLVAKPGLLDPNFRRTVVLVTQAEDASTVGVILNRPLREPLSRFLPDEPAVANYKDRVFEGGPVMRRVVVALFQSETVPAAPAFHVLRGLWLTMHPRNIRELLADPGRRYRLFSGFSGWAPGQLESELARDGWYVLRADVETVFRRNTEGMWEELLRKAVEPRPSADRSGPTTVASLHGVPETATRRNGKPRFGGALRPGSPGGAARAAQSFAAGRRVPRPHAAPTVAGGARFAPQYPDRSPGIPRSRPRNSQDSTAFSALQ